MSKINDWEERFAAQDNGLWDVDRGWGRTDLFLSFYALLAAGLAVADTSFRMGIVLI
jgi:hypothetical protein